MTEVQKKKIGLAVASMILGVFFWFPLLGIIFSILALIFGIIALTRVNKNKEVYGGGGMAISGIVLGGIGIILMPILGILAAIAIPNVVQAKRRAEELIVQSEIKSIVAACESYKTTEGIYPQTLENLSLDSSVFESVKKCGYILEYNPGDGGYDISARFISGNSSLIRNFVANESGELYIDGDKNGIAGTAGDKLISEYRKNKI